MLLTEVINAQTIGNTCCTKRQLTQIDHTVLADLYLKKCLYEELKKADIEFDVSIPSKVHIERFFIQVNCYLNSKKDLRKIRIFKKPITKI